MGGSKHHESLPGGLTLCSRCNFLLEADATFAAQGRLYGWKVHRNRAAMPSEVPIYHRPLREWFLLGDDGSRLIVDAPHEAA